jgi:hypothetical protein
VLLNLAADLPGDHGKEFDEDAQPFLESGMSCPAPSIRLSVFPFVESFLSSISLQEKP